MTAGRNAAAGEDARGKSPATVYVDVEKGKTEKASEKAPIVATQQGQKLLQPLQKKWEKVR